MEIIKKRRGRPPKEKPLVEKKKRGRPATGPTTAHKHLNFEIAAAYTSLIKSGIPSKCAVSELAGRQWMARNGKFMCLGEKAIREAITESRNFGITEDDFESSIRLQKVDPDWKDVFVIDPTTGKVTPK